MAKYSERAKEALLQYPLIYLLAKYGKRIDRSHCGELRVETGNFYSPFREEDAPSFHIDASKNLYYDYGEGKGGNALTLVARLEGCTLDRAWDILADLDRDSVVLYPADDSRNMVRSGRKDAAEESKTPKNVVTKVYNTIFNKELIQFLEKRFIPKNIAELYCKQVHFVCDGRKRIAIGFPNCTGGWAFRGEHEWKGKVWPIKSCTNQAITYIDNRGKFCDNVPNTSSDLAVFEGFFDFLSWTAMRSGWRPGMPSPTAILPHRCDVVVLNSCGNWSRAMNAYVTHSTVYSFLDDDKKGRETSEEVRMYCESAGVTFHDCSTEGCYGRSFNGVDGDLGDAWEAYCHSYLERQCELRHEQARARFEAEWSGKPEKEQVQEQSQTPAPERGWSSDWGAQHGNETVIEEDESEGLDL